MPQRHNPCCTFQQGYHAGLIIEIPTFFTAISDFHEALDIDSEFQRAKEGIQRAQKLQKQSEKRDYYKILGINRRATKTEITKAYRLVYIFIYLSNHTVSIVYFIHVNISPIDIAHPISHYKEVPGR